MADQQQISQLVAQVEWQDPPQVRASQVVAHVEWQDPPQVRASQVVVQVEWVDLADMPDTTVNVPQGLAGVIKLTRASTASGLAGAIQLIPYVSAASVSLSGKALLTRSKAVPALPGKGLLTRSQATLALPGEVLFTRARARMAVSGFVELMTGSSEVVLSDADRSLAGCILLNRASLSQGLAGAIKTGVMQYGWMPVSLNKWIDGAFMEVPLSSGADTAQLYMWGVLPDNVAGPGEDPGGGTTGTDSDNFNRADGPLGASWTKALGFAFDLTVSGNKAMGQLGTYGGMYYNGTFPADQYAQATIAMDALYPQYDDWCLAVRMTDTSAYAIGISPTVWNFYRITDSAWHKLGVTQSRATAMGTVVRLKVVGNTLSVSWDGGTTWDAYTVTDDFLTAGNPGLVLWNDGIAADDWSGGAATGSGSGTPTVYALPTGRAYDWKGNVGVTGGIPDRTTIYTTLSPSGGDDSGAIQTALNLCPTGQVVKLSAGTFLIKNNYIKVPALKVLRGSGMGVTTLKGTVEMQTKPFLLGFYNSPSYGTAVPAPNLTMGSKSVTTTRAHGLSVGDIIQIDQLLNPAADPPIQVTGYLNTATWIGRNGNRPLGMLNRVATVTSTTAFTTEIPLVWNFDSSGEVVKLNGTVSFAGIEDLSIDNQDSGSASQAGDWSTLVMHGAVDCWLRGVDLNGSFQTAIRIKYGYRNTLRACKVHEGVPYNQLHSYISGEGGRAYGLWIRPGSANLVENCRIYHCQIPITLNGESSANVFAYNFLTETYNGDDENWLHGAISPHGGHPVMNLFEGNYAFGRMCPDFVWGSSSHNVFFRQRVSTPDTTPPESPWRLGGMPYEQALRCYDIQAKNQYYSVIGCVTGTVGKETEFEYNGIDCPDSAKAIYRLGYAYDNPRLDQHDPQVAATLLRHGNWDSVHRITVYNGSDCQVLPHSLYLDAKPSWWGNTAWPPIGPDVTPMYPADPGSGMPW